MGEHTHHEKHEAHRQLIARLGQCAGDIRRLTAGLDEESLSKRTVAGKWSLKELVCHLWRLQDVFEARIENLLAEDNPAVVRYGDPDGDPEFVKLAARPAAESLAGFFNGRSRLVARLEKLSPAEWHRPGRHSDFPHFDVHFQVEYMLHHEAHHIYQMYQRRAPLGKLPH